MLYSRLQCCRASCCRYHMIGQLCSAGRYSFLWDVGGCSIFHSDNLYRKLFLISQSDNDVMWHCARCSTAFLAGDVVAVCDSRQHDFISLLLHIYVKLQWDKGYTKLAPVALQKQDVGVSVTLHADPIHFSGHEKTRTPYSCHCLPC